MNKNIAQTVTTDHNHNKFINYVVTNNFNNNNN